MWLGHDFSYEPLIGLIASIAAFVWDDTKQIIKSKGKDSFEHDQKVYKALVAVFEDKEIIFFLKEVNFNASFQSQCGLDIIVLTEQFEPPVYEFWDLKLEKYRKELFESLGKLAHRIAMCTYPIHNDRQTAIPDLYRNSFEPLPDEIENRINEMHKLASDVIEKYSVFYREGGKKFDKGI